MATTINGRVLTFDGFITWEQKTRDAIDFKKAYVDMTGDVLAGLVLSEIIYWYLPSKESEKNKLRVKRDGYNWIACRRSDWWERTRITPRQMDRIFTILAQQNIITKDVFKFGGVPMTHIRINEQQFMEAWAAVVDFEPENPFLSDGEENEFRLHQTVKWTSPFGEVDFTDPLSPLTEITTETTEEKTNEPEIARLDNEGKAPSNLSLSSPESFASDFQNGSEEPSTPNSAPPLLPAPPVKNPTKRDLSTQGFAPVETVKGSDADEALKERETGMFLVIANVDKKVSYLTEAQMRQLKRKQLPVVDDKQVEMDSPHELYESDPVFKEFITYVLNCQRAYATKQGAPRPSRSVIVDHICSYNRQDGWLVYEKKNRENIERRTATGFVPYYPENE
jgi:hypothetical protein